MAIRKQRTKLVRDIDEFRSNAFHDGLKLGKPGVRHPAAWFLGPKAENAAFLKEMVNRALESTAAARRAYKPDDPTIPADLVLGGATQPPAGEVLGVAASGTDDDATQDETQLFREKFDELLGHLSGSLPMASYRNQSHMYWDTTLPSILGYFATMLYNQNNCTPEASPITTALEMEVGDDLCRMLGYEIPEREAVRHGAIRPWGHITCDGSVANIESMWAARNIKYLAVALAAAIRETPEMAAGRTVSVRLLNGKRRHLVELDEWSLLNLPIDEVIKLPTRLVQRCGLSEATVEEALAAYSVQDLGLLEFHRRFLPNTPSPAVFVPATAHYSWHKAGSLLGLGRSAIHGVHVDLDARTDPVDLRRYLDQCLREGRPVVQVVAVIGSTEESAVDPLHEIVKIRNEYRELGLEFSLHADAAWGGYFASMIREPALVRMWDAAESEEERREIEREIAVAGLIDSPDDPGGRGNPNEPLSVRQRSAEVSPEMELNRYVRRQYEALRHCDTITVDPHKGGFILYPAGALCYRNGALRQFIAFASPVVAHGDVVQSVGFYGVEGSKPGASAAAVYLSHSLIPADRGGYGALLGKCIFASKRFYCGLVGMQEPDDPFYVTTFQRLPAEKVGAPRGDVLDQIDLIRESFYRRSDAEAGESPFVTNDQLIAALRSEYELRELFAELGSDQCIVAYTFNFRTQYGYNRKISRMNEMNERMFEAMSLQRFGTTGVPDNLDLIVTSSSFDPAVYGQEFVDTYARRIGVHPEPGEGIKFLISTQQNPWMTATAEGDFTPTAIAALRDVAREAADYVIRRHAFDHGEDHYASREQMVSGPPVGPSS